MQRERERESKNSPLKFLLKTLFFFVIFTPFFFTVNSPAYAATTIGTSITTGGTLTSADLITKGPWVDVRYYGATGDGTTNDTSAIQSAIDGATSGSVIFFPLGTYAVTSPILIQKSVSLVGAGPTSSIIKYKNGSTIGSVQPLIWIKPATSSFDHVNVSQLQIDGNSSNTTQSGEWNPGIEISTNDPQTVSYVWINKVHIKNTVGDGITVRTSSPYTVLPKNIIITDSEIEAYKDTRNGIAIIGGDTVTVTNNQIFNHPSGIGYAIDIEPNGNSGEIVTNVNIANNIITGVTYGFAASSTGSSVVSKITVHGNSISATLQTRTIASGVTGLIDYGNRITDGQFEVYSFQPLVQYTRAGVYRWLAGVDNGTYAGTSDFIIRDVNSSTTPFVIKATTNNFGVGGITSPNEKFEINGGMRLNTATSKPTCDSTHRGTLWFTQGAAGVKDALEVCAKDATDAYSWRTIY